jgi:hypothetical protein
VRPGPIIIAKIYAYYNKLLLMGQYNNYYVGLRLPGISSAYRKLGMGLE